MARRAFQEGSCVLKVEPRGGVARGAANGAARIAVASRRDNGGGGGCGHVLYCGPAVRRRTGRATIEE